VVDDFGSRQGRDVDPPDFDPVAFSREMRLGPFPVWRRSVDERFDEQFQSGGDYDLAIRLALRGPAVPCSELLGYYLDAGSGLSTSGELPAIERTVVQLRYGVFDTVDYSYLPEALGYDISRIKRDGEWISVADVVPGYDSLIKERSESWLDRGIERHYRRITSPGSRLARDVRGGAGAVKRFFGRLFGR
jgi:hypothetical protein